MGVAASVLYMRRSGEDCFGMTRRGDVSSARDGTEQHEGGTLRCSDDLTRLFRLVERFCLCEFEATGRQLASRRGFPRLSSVPVESMAIDSPFERALSAEIADGTEHQKRTR